MNFVNPFVYFVNSLLCYVQVFAISTLLTLTVFVNPFVYFVNSLLCYVQVFAISTLTLSTISCS